MVYAQGYYLGPTDHRRSDAESDMQPKKKADIKEKDMHKLVKKNWDSCKEMYDKLLTFSFQQHSQNLKHSSQATDWVGI